MTTYPERIMTWRTSDGKLFTIEASAVDHQERIERAARATAAIESGCSVGVALRDHGFIHPAQPHHELDDLYANSELIISYWQCCETPGYKPSTVRFDGCVYVSGDAGSWTGAYGGHVEIRELVRYWTDTKAALARFPGLVAQRDRAIEWRSRRTP